MTELCCLCLPSLWLGEEIGQEPTGFETEAVVFEHRIGDAGPMTAMLDVYDAHMVSPYVRVMGGCVVSCASTQASILARTCRRVMRSCASQE